MHTDMDMQRGHGLERTPRCAVGGYASGSIFRVCVRRTCLQLPAWQTVMESKCLAKSSADIQKSPSFLSGS